MQVDDLPAHVEANSCSSRAWPSLALVVFESEELVEDPLTRSIRVLALTASGDANSLMRARAAGAADAAPKLAAFDLLQRRITMLLGRAAGAVLSRHDS